MTRWAILDGDPAPGDPSAVGRLARQFGRAAEDFREGRARLHRMMAGSAIPSWQGPAATAFAGGLEPLRDDLGSAADSFEEASAALSAYSRILDTLQTQALGLLAQANQAQQRIDDANLALARAASNADREIALQGLDPLAAMIYRRQTIAPHQQAVRQAEEWLRSVRSQAQDLRREHEAAARRAADGLGHATDVGIHQTSRDRVTDWWARRLARGTWELQAVNEVTESWKERVHNMVLGAAAVSVGTGGLVSLPLKFALVASVTVNGMDVYARIARRALGDDTMTDSITELTVDAGLAALSIAVPLVGKAAANKGRVAITAVERGGYNTATYQQVNTAHQAMNQAILLGRISKVVSVYTVGFNEVRRRLGSADDPLPPATYAPPLPTLSPPDTARPVTPDAPTVRPQESTVAPLQSSAIAPLLQGQHAPLLPAEQEVVPGLQPIQSTVRTTRYQRPLEVRT